MYLHVFMNNSCKNWTH